ERNAEVEAGGRAGRGGLLVADADLHEVAVGQEHDRRVQAERAAANARAHGGAAAGAGDDRVQIDDAGGRLRELDGETVAAIPGGVDGDREPVRRRPRVLLAELHLPLRAAGGPDLDA